MAQKEEGPTAAQRRRGESGRLRGRGGASAPAAQGPPLSPSRSCEGNAVPCGRLRPWRKTQSLGGRASTKTRGGCLRSGGFVPAERALVPFSFNVTPDRVCLELPAPRRWCPGQGCCLCARVAGMRRREASGRLASLGGISSAAGTCVPTRRKQRPGHPAPPLPPHLLVILCGLQCGPLRQSLSLRTSEPRCCDVTAQGASEGPEVSLCLNLPT